jgi:hypothetical protein
MTVQIWTTASACSAGLVSGCARATASRGNATVAAPNRHRRHSKPPGRREVLLHWPSLFANFLSRATSKESSARASASIKLTFLKVRPRVTSRDLLLN